MKKERNSETETKKGQGKERGRQWRVKGHREMSLSYGNASLNLIKAA